MRCYKYLDKKFRKNVFRAGSLGLALLMASGSVAPMVSFAETMKVGTVEEDGEEYEEGDYEDDYEDSWLEDLDIEKLKELKAEAEILSSLKNTAAYKSSSQTLKDMLDTLKETAEAVLEDEDKDALKIGQEDVDQLLEELKKIKDIILKHTLDGEKIEELRREVEKAKKLRSGDKYLKAPEEKKRGFDTILKTAEDALTDMTNIGDDDIDDRLSTLRDIMDKMNNEDESAPLPPRLDDKSSDRREDTPTPLPPHLDNKENDRKEEKPEKSDKPVLPPHLEENLKTELEELKGLVNVAKKFEDDDEFKKFEDADIAALKSFLNMAEKLIKNPEGKTKKDIDEVLKPLSVMVSSMKKELDKREKEPVPQPPHIDGKGDGKQENTPLPPHINDKESGKKENTPQPPHIDDNTGGKKEEKPTPPQLGEDLKKKLDKLKELVDEARELEKEGKFSRFETDDIAALKGFLDRADKLIQNPFNENIDEVLKPLSVILSSMKEELSKREKENTPQPLPPHLDDRSNDKKEEKPSLPPHLEDKKEEKKENKPSARRESQPSNSSSRRASSRGSSSSRGGSSGSGARFRRSTGSGTNSGPVASLRTVALPDYVSRTGSWQQASNGVWTYSDRGEQAKDKWVAIQDKANNNNNQQQYNWFRFDKDGHLVTGWYKDSDGSMYYMNTKADGVEGVMRTGWVWIRDSKDGKLKAYYFNTNSDGTKGRMLFGTTVDGYTLNVSGEWVVDGVVQTK